MRNLTITGCVLLAFAVVPSRAHAQDMDAMSKWATAKVIHYHVVGDFSGATKVLKGKEAALDGTVADHVEIDFDWDQMQQKLASDPVFKNFPTKIESLDKAPACAAPKLSGPFEYFTFQSVRAMAVMFTFEGRRELPAGSFQYQAVEGGCGTVQAPAASEPVTARMQLGLGMMLAVPATPGFEMEISKDRKSFIQKINTDGWVWTMTPTVVK
jgi:hypothetical protein